MSFLGKGTENQERRGLRLKKLVSITFGNQTISAIAV